MQNRHVGKIVFLMLAMCSAGMVAAEDEPAPSPCAAWKDVPIPQAEATPSTDAKCSSDELYFGELGDGVGADFTAARACAFRERALHDADFAGPSVLMMIYANGKGVAQNPPLAKRFACEAQGSQFEDEGRLAHIDQLATAGNSAKPIDLCDDITSSYMIGACARRESLWQARRREVRFEALTATWMAPQRSAFEKLRKAAQAFANESASEEVDRNGTIRSYARAVTDEKLQAAFFERVQRCARGEFPAATAQEFKQADAALNATYAEVMKKARANSRVLPDNKDIVLPQGIRSTQLAWLKYREAWVEFGRATYPAVSADAWRADLSRERTQQWKDLQELFL